MVFLAVMDNFCSDTVEMGLIFAVTPSYWGQL